MPSPPEPSDPTPRMGVRELRSRVAAAVRRAGDGERIVVTVDGRPVAQLGPLEPSPRPGLEDLVAAGLLTPPRRPDRPPMGPPAPVPVDVGVDRIMAELRGESERPRRRGRAPLPGSAPTAIVEPDQGAGGVSHDASSSSSGRLVAVDSTALVRRWLPDGHRRLVADTLAGADAWCAAELARTEAMLALHRAAGDPFTATALWDRLRADWDAFFVVPVDGRCCARAAELGARFGLATVDAVHLAAADRLPRPVVWLTFDHRQIPAAAALGFEVVSPVA